MKKGETIVAFLTAQLHQRKALLSGIYNKNAIFMEISLNLVFTNERLGIFYIFVWSAETRGMGKGTAFNLNTQNPLSWPKTFC